MSIEELRVCELDCLKAIHLFCEENGLSYYLAKGSLIGAVRHKGFIPWDDDIDVFMPRRDYDFLVKNFCSSGFQVVAPENNPRCYTLFAKVINTKTRLLERHADYEIGAYVDIFPLDNLPNGHLRRFIFQNIIRVRRLCLDIASYSDLSSFVSYKGLIARMIHKIFINDKRRIKEINFAWKYPLKYKDQKESKFYMVYYIVPFVPELKADWFERQLPVEFEGNIYYAPVGYDALLRLLYGDYHTLPPESKRHPHHCFTCSWVIDEK